jgi:hypothetical protein
MIVTVLTITLQLLPLPVLASRLNPHMSVDRADVTTVKIRRELVERLAGLVAITTVADVLLVVICSGSNLLLAILLMERLKIGEQRKANIDVICSRCSIYSVSLPPPSVAMVFLLGPGRDVQNGARYATWDFMKKERLKSCLDGTEFGTTE